MDSKSSKNETSSKSNLKEERPNESDLIFLLISMFAQNDIEHEIIGERSILIRLENKEFELVLNQKEDING